MSARARVGLVSAASALAAAAAVVSFALLQSDGAASGEGGRPAARRAGAPPLFLDLGVRVDPRAQALRRAARLLEGGRRAEARALFERDGSLEGQVGAALAAWPGGTVFRLERLVRRHPRSALVRVNLGIARLWLGDPGQAQASWRRARRVEPDSLAAVRADDLLHPDSPRGLPGFVPSFAPPPRIASLPPERQPAALARAARAGGYRSQLLYGAALQRLGRPRSAERVFAAAAAAAPSVVEAQVAAAVGRFSKERPERAFSRLGPLARRFPRDPGVHFHLALLLIWLGEVEQGERRLARAQALGPETPLGRVAGRYLAQVRAASRGEG